MNDEDEKSQALGRVTGDLAAARGPDVSYLVVVPEIWRQEGARYLVRLPEKAACAACEGGGCDRCQRSGAFSLREAGLPSEYLEVSLPADDDSSRDVILRFPERGAESSEGHPRGHLLLRVRSGEKASSGVVRDRRQDFLEDRQGQSQAIYMRSIVMAIALFLLFLGMLKLSGWL